VLWTVTHGTDRAVGITCTNSLLLAHDVVVKALQARRTCLVTDANQRNKGITMKNSIQLSNFFKSPLLLAVAATFAVAGCSTQPTSRNSAYDYTGPTGAQGPSGPVGERGPMGEVGAPGVAIAGPAGATGPVGPSGMRGPEGDTGARGIMVVGRAGDTGPAGPAGAQGAIGATGAQGSSYTGPVGPRGPAGPAGMQGEVGLTGAQGPTTAGPTGATGRAGGAGVQGVAGYAGGQGSAELYGAVGPAGSAGVAGPQGPVGPTGERGPMAMSIGAWSGFWDYTFNGSSNDILHYDQRMAGDIAKYVNENQTRRLGIDGSDPQRVEIVRQALLNAGVPAWKMQVGAFGDPKLRRYGRVAVLVSA
jgi:hypothetical protein